jgi:hypothetical protein
MKTIKNTLLAIATVALVMPVFNGCKKGENDPAISLRSRKSRITGEWKVSKMEETQTTTPSCSGCYGSTDKTTFDGTSKTVVSTSAAPGSTASTWVYTVSAATLTIDKEGTYTYTWTEVLTSVDGTPVTGATPSTYTEEGVWNFSGGAGDTKSKSELVMASTKRTWTTGGVSSTSTTTGNTTGSISTIDQLKNKEMILKINETSVSSGTTPTTTVTESTTTLTQE